MDRRVRASLAVLASTALVGVIACTNISPEEKIVKDFFRASRLRDNATLGTFAVATFEPRTDGSVQNLKVISISDERKTPLDIRKYDAAFDEVKAAEDAFTKEKNDYQRKNIEKLQEMVKAEEKNQPIARKDLPMQAAWNKYREDAMKHSKAVSDARAQLGNSKGLAELSLSIPNGPTPDVTHMKGDTVAKDVTIEAAIKPPTGDTVTRTLVVTLQRCVMTNEKGETQAGRWIVTKVAGK
jgi:hypothetical protein